MIFILKIVGIFLAIGHFLGLLMFWSTNQYMATGIPLSLLMLSLAPVKKTRVHPWLLIVPAILIVVSYIMAGFPFLNTQDDAVARLSLRRAIVNLYLIFKFGY